MNVRLDDGVIAAYQQCPFSPDYFRDYTVIGPEGRPENSPVAARMSVAAGYMATLSLRNGGTPYGVPSLDPEPVTYFDGGRTRI